MTTWYKHLVYCTTEALDVESFGIIDPPTVCPNNNTHSIGLVTLLETRLPNQVKIQEEDVQTGGHFQADFWEVSIPANSTVISTYTNPDYPYGVLSTSFTTEEAHRGDTLDVIISPDTIIGTITAAVVATDTVLTVGQTVVDNIRVGFRVNLYDGPNTDNLGVVTIVDKSNLQITVSIAATQSFSPVTPTYVRMSVPFTRQAIKLGPPRSYDFGGESIGASYVPKATVAQLTYVNNSTQSKTIILYFSTLY